MIEEKLKNLPNQPGCYLFKDKNNVVIYVGKAKNLKNRVNSYFNSIKTGKTFVLVNNIFDLEYIITASDLEALLLEINLIKKYDPKYNVLLKDDKTYPYIEITNEKIPRLIISRPKIKSNKTKLFGPYPNVFAARKTIEILNRLYPLRKCIKMPKKVCLYYHINECLGFCEKKIDEDIIKAMVSEITKFLNGNKNIITNKLKIEMEKNSNILNFEKAKEMKEALDYIEITLRNQKIDLKDNVDRDIFGYYVYKNFICIQVLFLRGGKLVERDYSIYPLINDEIEDLNYFISTFYDKNNIKPKEILAPENVDVESIKNILNIKVAIPKRGNKKQLLEMAINNAKKALLDKIEMVSKNEDNILKALNDLKELLNVSCVNKIEIFDNSHLFGTFSVSGMVVFNLGKPNKNEYRKFKINSEKNDDYNLMKEVIYRRYFKVLIENLEKPDLIIVDGGKIQVKAAEEILENLNLKIPVCGLVKNEKHKTSNIFYKKEIIEIQKNSNLFYLLERIQDEVHNFVIRYHKNIRSKGALESILDNIDNIGEVRKKQILKKFINIDNMKKASIDELEEILPKKAANSFYNYFKEYK